MVVPQRYNLKALEPIGYLLAVDPHSPIISSLYCLKWDLTASYMRDK
nr:hypothetical protein JUJ52_21250 [Virgibacillus sp. AGTR]